MQRPSTRRMIGFLVLCGLVWLGNSPAASAGQNSASVSAPNGVTATVNFPDYIVSGTSCQDVPYTVSFENNSGFTVLRAEARPPRSNSGITIFATTSQPGNSSQTLASTFCPGEHPTGPYRALLMIESEEGSARGTDPLLFSIGSPPTDLRVRAKATSRGTVVRITGTTSTANGREGIRGAFRVETLTPKVLGGSGKWFDWGTALPNPFGKLVTEPLRYPRVPKGAQVRVSAQCFGGACQPKTVVAKVR